MNEWVTNGPTNGIINALCVSPNYLTDKTVFAGTNGSGIYKSTDGGQSWVQSGLASSYILALAVSSDYASNKTIFAGTYGGVYRSTNGGQGWSLCGLAGVDVSSLAISVNNTLGQTIYAGTYGQGVYKSTDGGSTWAQSGLVDAHISSFAVWNNSPDNTNTPGNTVFAGASDGKGVYKSTDEGRSWTQVNDGIASTNIRSIAVTPNYASSSTVYADKYKSTDGGQSWTQVGPTGAEIFSLAVSPDYATDNTVFAGTYGQGVYKSTDGGSSWVQINSGLEDNYVPSLVISPNFAQDSIIFAGTWGGGVFSCPTNVDFTPPTVTTTNPADGATGVSKDETITVTFSENVTAGVAYDIVTVKDSDGRQVDLNKSISNRTMLINPADDLAYGSTYTVIIPANAVKDSASNSLAVQYRFSFTTQDVTPPTVTVTDPADGATGVAKNKTVTVTFSENVTAGSAYDSITIKDGSNSSLNATKSINGNVLALYPTTGLSYKTQYTVTIPANAVKDLADNALANQFVFKFTVPDDTFSPNVIGTNPPINAIGIAKDVTITVSFDETVQAGSAYSGIAMKDDSNTNINISTSIKDGVLTIDPSSDLVSGVVYTVTIPADAVKDSVNNSFGTQYTFNFTVQADAKAPSSPEGLNLVSSINSIQLAWNANAEADLAGYNIYRKLKGTVSLTKLNSSIVSAVQYTDHTAAPGYEQPLRHAQIQLVQYTDHTAAPGYTYVYCIAAVDKSGNESQKSAELQVIFDDLDKSTAFIDILEGAWYGGFVATLISKGIVKGYPDNTFRPDNPVSRAEFAAMICLAKGWELTDPAASSFADVSMNHWAFKFIETAKTKGVIGGYAEGKFRPEVNITRAEIAKIIAQSMSLTSGSSALTDISASWAKDFINACVTAGIISGYADSTYRPDKTASRAEVSKIIAIMIGAK